MAGPGVKKGQRLERTVHLVDVAPTVCRLAELPKPTECEGGVLYQALVNPHGPVKELQRLRKQAAQEIKWRM
jgi:arylsulfatase A-like enzyme